MKRPDALRFGRRIEYVRSADRNVLVAELLDEHCAQLLRETDVLEEDADCGLVGKLLRPERLRRRLREYCQRSH